MATVVVRTIGSDGGDNYATIGAWRTATSTDLVASDTIEVGELRNEDHVLAGNVTITGATTDAGHYRVLRPASGGEYDPVTGLGCRIVQTGDNSRPLDVGEQGFRAYDLGLVLQGTNFTSAVQAFRTGADATNSNGAPICIERCVGLLDGVSDNNYAGFYARPPTSGCPVIVRDCILIGNGTAVANWRNGFLCEADGTYGTTLDNCDAHKCERGVVSSNDEATQVFRNVVSCGSVDNDFVFTGGTTNFTPISCASEDSTAMGTAAINGIVTREEFVHAERNDFRIRHTSQNLLGNGRNLSPEGFTADIEGTSFGAHWNIGAYAGSVPIGYSRADDIRVEEVVFVASGDVAAIDTNGYDYLWMLPVGPDGTAPPTGTMTFSVYASPGGDPDVTLATRALIPQGPKLHQRATVTSTARTAGYLERPPQHVIISATDSGDPSANMRLRVELRKSKVHGQSVGRA